MKYIGFILIFAALLSSCGGGGGGGGGGASNDAADATLANLSVSTGSLAPGFSPAVISYATGVTVDTASTDVAGTVAAAGATMKVDNIAVTSGTAHTVSLPVGSTPIPILVIAANGTTTKTYTITVTRPSISLTPVSSNIAAPGSVDLTVKLAAAPVADATVSLSAIPGGIVSFPSTVTVPAANTRATFTVMAVSAGTVTITADLGGETANATITVTP